MKNEIVTKLSEVDRAVTNLMIFNLAINSVIVFLGFAILSSFLRFDIKFAVIPPVLYLPVALLWKKMRTDSIDLVTERYPTLDERLQTAYDSRDRTNFIIRRLNNDVSKRMDEIASSSFMDTKKITYKSIMAVFLAFLFLSINFINFSQFSPLGSDFLDDVRNIGDSLGIGIGTPPGSEPGAWESGNYSNEEEEERLGGQAGGQFPGISDGPIPGRGGGAGYTEESEIFGEPSSAKIEGENINIEIHPEYGGEIEIKNVDENGMESEEFSVSDVKGSRAPEEEPLKYEQMIKRYFEKLVEESE